GQVDRAFKGREAFQEMNYEAVFGSMAKWVTEVADPMRIPEVVSRAFSIACNGRPGPVVIALPEDMLQEQVSVDDVGPAVTVETFPSADDMATFLDLLQSAERPLMVVGGTRWTPRACADLRQFAERFDLPILTSYRRLPLFDPLHP